MVQRSRIVFSIVPVGQTRLSRQCCPSNGTPKGHRICKHAPVGTTHHLPTFKLHPIGVENRDQSVPIVTS